MERIIYVKNATECGGLNKGGKYMKVAVIINDSSTANLIEAFSPADAIGQMMQHCIIQKITVYKVVAYLLIELGN